MNEYINDLYCFPSKIMCTDYICIFLVVFSSFLSLLTPLPKQIQRLLSVEWLVCDFMAVFCIFSLGKEREREEKRTRSPIQFRRGLRPSLITFPSTPSLIVSSQSRAVIAPSGQDGDSTWGEFSLLGKGRLN